MSANKPEFYLGTHILNHMEKTNVPLFISFKQLRKRKRKPFAQKGKIYVDSGGFSELSINGKWTISPKEYILELERLKGIGLNIQWAAQQDHMCEDFILEKTGLTIEDHQKLTVQNLIELRAENSSIHFIPVLQGQTLNDYFKHFDLFEENGIDLRSEPIVGVGSVCRRQNTDEIGYLFKCLSAKGIKIHGFGVKIQGIKKYGQYLKSADSMAWSFGARHEEKCGICKSNAKNCANCLDYALKWRQKVIS